VNRAPTFAVATASSNSAEKLRKTIPTVRSQNASFEFFIIDGASTEQSLTIAKEAAEKNHRIIVCSEPDTGIYDDRPFSFGDADALADVRRPAVACAVQTHPGYDTARE
jgi:hypothetical protein